MIVAAVHHGVDHLQLAVTDMIVARLHLALPDMAVAHMRLAVNIIVIVAALSHVVENLRLALNIIVVVAALRHVFDHLRLAETLITIVVRHGVELHLRDHLRTEIWLMIAGGRLALRMLCCGYI